MPIRINLLAEQQAAEDLRRRDPIKRALFGGCALTVAMLGWIALTQMQVSAARSELATTNERLKKVEESSKQVRNRQLAALDGSSRVKALDQYAANRHFWGTFLDALQRTTVDSIRLTEIRTDQKFASSDVHKFFTTNVTVTYTPPPPAWKFWAKADGAPAVTTLVSNQFPTITNSAPFTTNVFNYTTKITETGTNVAMKQLVAQVDFSNVAWAMERTVVELRGRDYGTTPGAALDEFARRITDSPYFKKVLNSENGLRFTERPPQPRPDPQDVQNPNALFVPFTIELVLEERRFTNETL